MYLETLTAD